MIERNVLLRHLDPYAILRYALSRDKPNQTGVDATLARRLENIFAQISKANGDMERVWQVKPCPVETIGTLLEQNAVTSPLANGDRQSRHARGQTA